MLYYDNHLYLISKFSGDCCGVSDYEWCNDCQCKHDQGKLEADMLGLGFFHNDTCPLEFKAALGDGFCHDELNIEDCQYDGGDCCKPVVFDNACTECRCWETGDVKPLEHAACPLEFFVEDGFCEDESNIPQCGYDGGDCCGAMKLTFCSDCSCYNPSQANLPRRDNHFFFFCLKNFCFNFAFAQKL